MSYLRLWRREGRALAWRAGNSDSRYSTAMAAARRKVSCTRGYTRSAQVGQRTNEQP